MPREEFLDIVLPREKGYVDLVNKATWVGYDPIEGLEGLQVGIGPGWPSVGVCTNSGPVNNHRQA